jgi:hypothetical protein
VFHETFTKVSREFRESFTKVARELRESFAGVARTIEISRARSEIKVPRIATHDSSQRKFTCPIMTEKLRSNK